MQNKFLLLGIALFTLTACKTTSLQVANVQTQKNISINKELKDDEGFAKFIEPYTLKLNKEMNQKISYTLVNLTKEGDNSNLGNLLADYTFDGADVWTKANLNKNVDAALINIGGIRTTIGKGDILLKNVFEVMPFENEVIIVKMKGADLQGLFDYYAKTQVNNPVSHLYIETNNGQLTKTLIKGKAVNPNQDYYIATSDYLALGGDNMKFFSKGESIPTGIKLRDLFIDYFKKNAEINPKEDIRLNFIGKK
ncbi:MULTISPECIES: 5'-nucleotidase C-terminal domain-containing protein [Chryseobacterium]|uniref:5'-nucleotidase C-terminal domain-containing protein n=1 Tax=Chryseobacterium TaxID=59732 RepID=UPI000FADECDE|nr:MULTISPECIES: 5'-nucleotidase C-terminal domain-containing protein [Chryseobacterium]MBM7421537.1 2',3'-cyclic-nucleotide 2'-phosphodiesterase (5'-nucleotidase family) [Chryseobacterium sp. JUb44]MDH6211504.1 2',3'-cyclic-nucleotide 2'-phosphodiesterase (5'-nucleotidase family) [Chryseobacterium sp. BIGb0186]WSO10149.1 5'-nucleotidase C-terminal domain-containing protein [Chryseobacterium scophthalmum]